MGISGKITALCLGALCAAFGPARLRAQEQPIPQSLRDSLANPPKAERGDEAMRFETSHIDIGRINEDDPPAESIFRWRNTGDRPLVITRVETTCGCARPAYERRPILPGEEGSLTVTYHPKRHPGSFHRRIFVFTQLSDKLPTAILNLTGQVTPSTLPTSDYPYAMNTLLLKQRSVRINGTRIQTERIECLNAGQTPLHITADTLLLPPYVRFECEPATIPPGRTGDLVFRFRPELAPERLPDQVPVILQGMDLPPSQSTVRILIGTDR